MGSYRSRAAAVWDRPTIRGGDDLGGGVVCAVDWRSPRPDRAGANVSLFGDQRTPALPLGAQNHLGGRIHCHTAAGTNRTLHAADRSRAGHVPAPRCWKLMLAHARSRKLVGGESEHFGLNLLSRLRWKAIFTHGSGVGSVFHHLIRSVMWQPLFPFHWQCSWLSVVSVVETSDLLSCSNEELGSNRNLYCRAVSAGACTRWDRFQPAQPFCKSAPRELPPQGFRRVWCR